MAVSFYQPQPTQLNARRIATTTLSHFVSTSIGTSAFDLSWLVILIGMFRTYFVSPTAAQCVRHLPPLPARIGIQKILSPGNLRPRSCKNSEGLRNAVGDVRF
jgi:hypothetical protein